MCLDFPPQARLVLLVCLVILVGFLSSKELFTLGTVPTRLHDLCLWFVPAGLKGDRGYTGDHSTVVRTSESSSRAESEYTWKTSKTTTKTTSLGLHVQPVSIGQTA